MIALALIGAALLAAAAGRPGGAGRRRRLIWAAVIVLVALCLADWVLVQDFGFFGGLGTDPNSMIPMALLAVAAGLALTARCGLLAACRAAAREARRPRPRGRASPPRRRPRRAAWPRRRPGSAGPGRLAAAAGPAALAESFGMAGIRTVLSASAVAVIALGAVPMAAAQASPSAAPILAQAIDGSAAPLHSPAPAFALTDQDGRRVSLASLRGKAVLLTFLDPVCVTDCPLLAQEFRQAGVLLGAEAGKVELVAVNLNPLYRSTAYTRAFDRQERLARVPDWLFLTGSPAQLQPVWRDYGVAASDPAGSMSGTATPRSSSARRDGCARS